jgi:hypothetical protein
VEDDSLEQVAERHVVKFGEGLQYFEQALFDADAGLDPFDEQAAVVRN